MIPPLNIPAIAPFKFVRFQNNANSITGPKVAPNPAHAKDTIWNTLLLGLDARNMAIIEITITVALATTTFFFSESLIPNTPSNIFSVTLDEAAKSCESDVDMVDARIPARIIPATMAKIKPCLLITVEI